MFEGFLETPKFFVIIFIKFLDGFYFIFWKEIVNVIEFKDILFHFILKDILIES